VPRPADVRLRHEFAVFRNPQVVLAMAMTVLGFGGVFAAITYIAPMMTHVAGFADSSVIWLMVLFGLGMVAGNLVGGRVADRKLMPMLFAALGGLVISAGFGYAAPNWVGAVLAAAALALALVSSLLERRRPTPSATAPATVPTAVPTAAAARTPGRSAVSSSN
jgi:DHA1 family inner membrane transport protein